MDSQGRPEDKLVVLVKVWMEDNLFSLLFTLLCFFTSKLLHSKRLEYHKMKLQLRCVRSSEPGEGRVAGPCSGEPIRGAEL